MQKRKTKLTLWVEAQGGPGVVAKMLKISPHAVRVWMRGDGWPTILTARKMLKLSKGKLTPKDIFECSGGPLK